jgi:hypothetical protein
LVGGRRLLLPVPVPLVPLVPLVPVSRVRVRVSLVRVRVLWLVRGLWRWLVLVWLVLVLVGSRCWGGVGGWWWVGVCGGGVG